MRGANLWGQDCVKGEMQQCMSRIFTCFALAILTFSCDEEVRGIERIRDSSLTGTWLYTEYGYSPGAGYFTEPVSPIPPQTITLMEDLTLRTNIQGLTKYRFYRILEDPNGTNLILAMYAVDPGDTPQDITQLEHSYSIIHEDDLLRLNYRWCFEGCHIGLKKLSE